MGFDSLPDQLVNKAVGKGFDFNILCVGRYKYVDIKYMYVPTVIRMLLHGCSICHTIPTIIMPDTGVHVPFGGIL